MNTLLNISYYLRDIIGGEIFELFNYSGNYLHRFYPFSLSLFLSFDNV